MRHWVFAGIALALLIAGLFVPWGQKEVTRIACEGNWQSGHRCISTQYDASYYGLRLEADKSHQQVDPYEGKPVKSFQEYSYFRSMPHQGPFDMGLQMGPLVALFGGITSVLAAVALQVDRLGFMARPAALTSVGLSATGVGAMLLGMGLHSATWAGITISAWTPHVGTLLGLVAVGSNAWLVRLCREPTHGLPPLPTAPSKVM